MSRYLLAVTAAAAAVGVLFAGTATAQPDDEPLSGDDRATAYAGNVVAEDCAELYPGSTEVTPVASVDESNTYLEIKEIGDGDEVFVVIVKGGPAYNEYLAEDLGDLSWQDLHPPLVSSGEPAEISHWFACGTTTEPTTTVPTSETTTTTSTPDTTTATVPTTSEGVEPTTTTTTTTTATSAEVDAVADEQDLASTGFNGGWLVVLAAALLLSGGALLLIVRLRGARR